MAPLQLLHRGVPHTHCVELPGDEKPPVGTSPTPEGTPAQASLLCLSSSQSAAPQHGLPAPDPDPDLSTQIPPGLCLTP